MPRLHPRFPLLAHLRGRRPEPVCQAQLPLPPIPALRNTSRDHLCPRREALGHPADPPADLACENLGYAVNLYDLRADLVLGADSGKLDAALLDLSGTGRELRQEGTVQLGGEDRLLESLGLVARLMGKQDVDVVVALIALAPRTIAIFANRMDGKSCERRVQLLGPSGESLKRMAASTIIESQQS